MHIHFNYIIEFSKSGLRDVNIRFPIIAEHYVNYLQYQLNYPLKSFKSSDTIFGQIHFPTLRGKIVRVLLDLSVKTTTEIVHHPNWGDKEEYDSKDIQRYCISKPYWEVKSKNITKISKQIQAKSKNIHDLIFYSFQFVRKSILLPEKQSERHGALRALKNGIGDCDEFTDLFITILRALNIPTRRVTGVFVSSTEIENHTWAEVLIPTNPKTWITMDVALGFFGIKTSHHLARKVEGTLSAREDIVVNWKDRKKVALKIEMDSSFISID